jgi:hypothetical protein
MAAEISRIRSLPGEERTITAIRKNAKISPTTAHNIDNWTPELRIVRARKIMGGSPESRGL